MTPRIVTDAASITPRAPLRGGIAAAPALIAFSRRQADDEVDVDGNGETSRHYKFADLACMHVHHR